MEKLRFRAEIAAPCETYDQLGYELDAGYRATKRGEAQGGLFAYDYAQPVAPDNEPVFWQETISDAPGFYPDEAPADLGYQADADVGEPQPLGIHFTARNLTRAEAELCLDA